MNYISPDNDSSLATVLRQLILPMFPSALHAEMERELPSLALQAYQVGVNVLVAENEGLRFSDAVQRPEFLVMGRIYFGASNFLQWQLPPLVHTVLRGLLQRTVNGEFEPARRLLFVIASRKSDPEAALCRFLLWVAVRINLLVLTWRDPGVELRGSIQESEDEAESTLRNMLECVESDPNSTDCRPLHVLMADALFHMCVYDRVVSQALSEVNSEFQEMLTNVDALDKVRCLDARTAAVFNPGKSGGEMGSQQIADRYPQHFSSANALEQHRSRFRRRGRKAVAVTNARLIDVLREAMGEKP